MIRFSLPRILPLINKQLRTHRMVRRKKREALAWEIKAMMGPLLPQEPFQRARVTIDRYSVGDPDPDNLPSSAKDLLDCLVMPSKRHPFGLGIIVDDSRKLCQSVVRAFRVKHRHEQKTDVQIEELPPDSLKET